MMATSLNTLAYEEPAYLENAGLEANGEEQVYISSNLDEGIVAPLGETITGFNHTEVCPEPTLTVAASPTFVEPGGEITFTITLDTNDPNNFYHFVCPVCQPLPAAQRPCGGFSWDIVMDVPLFFPTHPNPARNYSNPNGTFIVPWEVGGWGGALGSINVVQPGDFVGWPFGPIAASYSHFLLGNPAPYRHNHLTITLNQNEVGSQFQFSFTLGVPANAPIGSTLTLEPELWMRGRNAYDVRNQYGYTTGRLLTGSSVSVQVADFFELHEYYQLLPEAAQLDTEKTPNPRSVAGGSNVTVTRPDEREEGYLFSHWEFWGWCDVDDDFTLPLTILYEHGLDASGYSIPYSIVFEMPSNNIKAVEVWKQGVSVFWLYQLYPNEDWNKIYEFFMPPNISSGFTPFPAPGVPRREGYSFSHWEMWAIIDEELVQLDLEDFLLSLCEETNTIFFTVPNFSVKVVEVWIADPIDPVPGPNRDALREAKRNANAIERGRHTTTTWNAFIAALERARLVYENPNATQAEIDAAKRELLAAKGALEKYPRNNQNNVITGVSPRTGDMTSALPLLAGFLLSMSSVLGGTSLRRKLKK